MQRCRAGVLGPSLRTALAVTVVLVFWVALARAYWSELAPALLQLFGAARQVGADVVPSVSLEVRNRSTAPAAVVREVVQQLERHRQALAPYLERETSYRVPVLIADGSGPALTDGVRLLVFYDRGRVDLATAPALLVALGEGSISLPGLRLFVEGGYALYIAEEADLAQGLLGVSTDAWAALMYREGTLIPLGEAWDVGLVDTGQSVRALLQGASLMRWLSRAHGVQVLRALRDGSSLEQVTGMSPDQVEGAWLASLAGVSAPPSCDAALPAASPLRPYCGAIAP
jgi:hypothetical protein